MILRFLASCYHWVAAVGTMLVYVVGYRWVCLLKPETDRFEYFWAMTDGMLKRSGIDLTVKGLENFDRNKSYIITFNHINVMDHVTIYQVLHAKLTGLQKESNLRLPIYGSLMRQFGVIPIVPRGNTQKSLAALEVAKKTYLDGVSILIAPEGTRCRDGVLAPFKKGGFHMAVDLKAEILPLVYDAGMFRYNNRKQFLLHPGPVTLTICPPISTASYSKETVSQLAKDVREVYLDQLGSEKY